MSRKSKVEFTVKESLLITRRFDLIQEVNIRKYNLHTERRNPTSQRGFDTDFFTSLKVFRFLTLDNLDLKRDNLLFFFRFFLFSSFYLS